MSISAVFFHYMLIGWPIFTVAMILLMAKKNGQLTVMDVFGSVVIGILPFLREVLLFTLLDITNKVIWTRKR